MTEIQQKAERLLTLHHTGKLLILPNIWDVLGAKLLQQQGFEAIATASAAVAFSNGYNDGQEIDFDEVLTLVEKICISTPLPITVDLEKGYAETNDELSENIKKLISSGAVGINFEDSMPGKNELLSIDQQCEKIAVIRKTAEKLGVHLVINARTDVFIPGRFNGNKVEEAIVRENNYRNAGADCFYPILCSSQDLTEMLPKIELPVNVIATKDTLPMTELEKIGVARLSLGPALLRTALTKMMEVVISLKNNSGYELFTNDSILTSSEIVKMIKS